MKKQISILSGFPLVRHLASMIATLSVVVGAIWFFAEANAERFVDKRISSSAFAKTLAEHDAEIIISNQRDIRVEEQLKAIKDDSDEIKEAIKAIERYMLQGRR